MVSDALINSLLNILSGTVALLVSIYAFRANRLVGISLLRYISFGFMMLGVGLVLEGLTQITVGVTPVTAVLLRRFELFEFIIYTFIQLAAYGVFAWGYGKSTFGVQPVPGGSEQVDADGRRAATRSFFQAISYHSFGVLATSAAATVRRLSGVFIVSVVLYAGVQLAVIALLLFVVVLGTMVYMRSHSGFALTVLFGFVFIFIGHIIQLSAVLLVASLPYLIGNLTQFFGFVFLLYFLLWSGRVGST